MRKKGHDVDCEATIWKIGCSKLSVFLWYIDEITDLSFNQKTYKARSQTVSILQSQHIFELVNDSVMTRSMEGIINFWNHSAEELYGWRKEEAIGKVSHSLLRTQFPRPLQEIESELVRNGRWEGKLVHTTRDGGRVVVESRWSLELKGQLGALVEINTRSTDPEARIDKFTTPRRQSQNVPGPTVTTLQQPEHLFELVNDSVMTRTMEGVINFWNQSAEQLYGWRKEEAVGRVSHDLLRTEFPKPLEEIESELVRNGRWEGKLVHTTRDGGRVVVESRWSLELKGQLGGLVEINKRSTDRGGRIDTDSGEVEREGPLPTSKLLKAEDLLPRMASMLLAGLAALCIFVSCYFIYYYVWTGQRQFNTPLGMVLYVVLPAVLASLLLVFLRRKPEFKVNAAMVCVSLIVPLYGVELFLRLTEAAAPKIPAMTRVMTSKEKQIEAAKLTKKFGIEIDARGGFEVIDDLRKRGIDAVPIITPSNHLFVEQPDGSIKSAIDIHGTEVMPFGGISNRVTVLCNENGTYVTYQSDEHGFQNPKGMWQSEDIDIAALGDSFAHGYCVPADKTFVALIRHAYPMTLNLGMAGNGPLLMLANLKEYLPLYRPKVVLWFYFEGNDLTNLQTEKKSAILMRYLRDDISSGFAQTAKRC